MNGDIENQIREQGFYVSTTVGCSMKPMLRNRRDRVIISPVTEKLKKFDLPLYVRPDGKYILHRIIGLEDGGYIIRGDNTFIIEHVPDDWVIGYVTEFYRGKHHVLSDNKFYRFYAKFWNLIFPVRHFFHGLHEFYLHLRHKVALALHIHRNKTSG